MLPRFMASKPLLAKKRGKKDRFSDSVSCIPTGLKRRRRPISKIIEVNLYPGELESYVRLFKQVSYKRNYPVYSCSNKILSFAKVECLSL